MEKGSLRTAMIRGYAVLSAWLNLYKALYSAARKGIRLIFLTQFRICGNTNYLGDASKCSWKSFLFFLTSK